MMTHEYRADLVLYGRPGDVQLEPAAVLRAGRAGSCDRRPSVRRHHAGVRAREVDRLVAVLPADPVVLPLALPDHLDHLAVAPEGIERGGVDDDLVTLLGVHPASSDRCVQAPAQRMRSPGAIAHPRRSPRFRVKALIRCAVTGFSAPTSPTAPAARSSPRTWSSSGRSSAAPPADHP